MSTLITAGQWSHIRQKAALPQFSAAQQLLRQEVADFLARPVDVPQLPGGYYHAAGEQTTSARSTQSSSSSSPTRLGSTDAPSTAPPTPANPLTRPGAGP